MTQEPASGDIQLDVTVPVDAGRAFALFTEGFGSWWPPAYTWAGDVLETIVIEPGQGGRCYERGPHGFTVDWGRVLVWEPPRRLVFTWQISPRREPVPDPARASEVEVTFEPVEGGARVALTHLAFDRHGEGADDYRFGMASQQGWPYILALYQAACTKTA